MKGIPVKSLLYFWLVHVHRSDYPWAVSLSFRPGGFWNVGIWNRKKVPHLNLKYGPSKREYGTAAMRKVVVGKSQIGPGDQRKMPHLKPNLGRRLGLIRRKETGGRRIENSSGGNDLREETRIKYWGRGELERWRRRKENGRIEMQICLANLRIWCGGGKRKETIYCRHKAPGDLWDWAVTNRWNSTKPSSDERVLAWIPVIWVGSSRRKTTNCEPKRN